MEFKRLNSGYNGYLPAASENSAEAHAPVRTDTFYGRLGSAANSTGSDCLPARRVSFDRASSLRRIRAQLTYDEEAYPGGLDIDMFALLYDKAGNFVDCIFYKHPEDASGSFSLNQKTNSLSIDLEAVPDTCHTIVLAAAVYTTGLSLMELEGGLIEISEGFIGPTLFSTPLQLLSSRGYSSSTAGLLFFALTEFGGKWRCRTLETFCEAELPSLMKLSKEEAKRIEDDFSSGNLQNLRTLDFAARVSETTPPNSSTLRFSGSQGAISINTSKLHKLQSRLSSSKSADDDTRARLGSVEEEQHRMSRRLTNIEEKLDLLLDALKR